VHSGCPLLAESAISVKPPKAVAGWFAAASDRQLGGATTIACFRPGAVLRGIATSDDFRLRLCENACSNEVDKKTDLSDRSVCVFLDRGNGEKIPEFHA
jgi:hypothetical protein